MQQKPLVKYMLISILLVAAALSLPGQPFADINASPAERTPGPAADIRARLQPYQTLGAEPAQSDGRQSEEAPLPSRLEEPPIAIQDQETFDSIADATVLQGYPTTNFGDTIDMWAGYDDDPDIMAQIARSLIQYDISSLPSDIKITKATLWVYLVNSRDYPDTSRTITAYRITGDWVESAVTWNNKPGYGSAYGSKSIVHGAWDWYDFDVTDLVKAWYAGTYPNYGIMLRGPEISGDDSSRRGFSTREGSYTPRLDVEYTQIASYAAYLPGVLKRFILYAPPCGPNNNYCETCNTPETAYGTLKPGQAYMAYPNDERDYYYFVMLDTTSVTVRVTNYQGVGQLVLRREDLSSIDADARNPGGDYTLEVTQNLSPGKYYVQIYTSGSYSQSALYTLTVNQ